MNARGFILQRQRPDARPRGVEIEKLNLRTKEAVDVGLEALWEDVKQWPEAVEAWQKFYDLVKRLEAGGKGPAIVGNS
ncbi:MAG: hypothetical protein ACLPT4_14530 [Verrucomicrobiia bacterium]